MLRLLVLSALLAALAGCGSVSEIGGRTLVVQGRYDWMPCEQILPYIAMYRVKETDLVETMNKSAQDTSGHIINAAVHLPTLTETRGHLRELEQARVAKKCEPPK